MATCSVCGKQRKSLEPVTITWRDQVFVLDICGEDAAKVEELTKLGSTEPKPATSSHKPAVHKVEPID